MCDLLVRRRGRAKAQSAAVRPLLPLGVKIVSFFGFACCLWVEQAQKRLLCRQMEGDRGGARRKKRAEI